MVVPKVVGLSQEVAVDRIEQAGLDRRLLPGGVTEATRHRRLGGAGGRNTGSGAIARAHQCLARPRRRARSVAVPDVLGQAESDARHALIQAGFTVQTLDQPTSDPTENGVVLKQKPDGGGQAPVGSQIVIYVGRVPAPTQ